MTGKSIELTDELYRYLLRVSVREAPLLQRLREETASLPLARMQIAPEQGQFMALLVKLIAARRIIEIGVFTGYSSLCLAQAMAAGGRLIACDINEEWTAVARRYWREAGLEDRIELILGAAAETLERVRREHGEGSFDMAFIDADKTNYDTYYELTLQLLRRGGLLLIDNVLWSGRVADPHADDDDTRALRALNAKLHDDVRIDLSLLPLADGLTLAIKR